MSGMAGDAIAGAGHQTAVPTPLIDGVQVIGTPTHAAWGEAAILGFAMRLLVDTDRSRLSIASLHTWLNVPIRLGQFVMLFGDRGTPLGYATWAYVTPETAARLGDGSGRPPMLEDWNDGSLLWIVDVVAPYGDVARLIRSVRALCGEHHEMLGFAARRDGRQRIYHRRLLRHRPTA